MNDAPTPQTDLFAEAYDLLPNTVMKFMRHLEREAALAKAALDGHARDWADAHSVLQELVRAHVPGADVEGDSNGVPGIITLARMLAAECERLRTEYECAVANWEESAMNARTAKHWSGSSQRVIRSVARAARKKMDSL